MGGWAGEGFIIGVSQTQKTELKKRGGGRERDRQRERGGGGGERDFRKRQHGLIIFFLSRGSKRMWQYTQESLPLAG